MKDVELQVKKVKLENGEILSYREAGQGDQTLLLIHGNMSSGVHFLPLVKRLPPAFKAYLVDLRGFGDSTYNNRINSIKDLSDDLYAFVNELKIKDFTMVGWSAGGSVCLQFGADYPGMVNKTILIDSVSFRGCPLLKKDAQGETLIGEVYQDRWEMAEDPEVALCLQAIENKDVHQMSLLWDMAIYTNHKPLSDDNREYIKATLKQRNLVDIYWALALFNMSNEPNGYAEGSNLITKITTPILSFWGEKDIIIPEDAVKATVAALGDNAKLVILEACGHSPLVDCPDIVMQKMVDFIL